MSHKLSAGAGISNGGFSSIEMEEDERMQRCTLKERQLHRKQCAKARKFATNPSPRRHHSIQATKTISGSEIHHFKRTFSISSESNTSQTELQGHHQAYHTTDARWHSGCCIWIQQVLTNAIDQMLNTKDLATIRRTKAALDESADEFVWNQIPDDCLDEGILFAALKGHVAMLECFLQRGSHLASDSCQRTALHYAASSSAAGAGDCIAILIKYGANVNAWDQDRQATPLICAAASGREELVDLLLKANADVNAGMEEPNGTSALMWAVRARSFVCATRLINAGAAVNSSRAYSEMPIHVAAVQGDVECMKLLLEKQADVRVLLGAERRNPLHLAASEGNVGCIRLLLGGNKVEIDAVDAKGRTPLHLAALAQSVESVSELLRHGARHDISDETKKSPLHSAVVRGSRSTDVVRLLIQSGADVNARDELDQTPLHLAAINENSKLADILILSGADLAAKNQGGSTSLSFVVRRVPDALAAIPRRLDLAVLKGDHDPVDPDCELHMDFRVLVPGGDQQQVGELRMLTSLVMADQRHVLQHPVIRAFLYLKWFRIRSLFLVSLFFHFFFVTLLTVTILSTYVFRDSANNSTNNVTSEPEFRHYEWNPTAVNIIRYLTIFFGSVTAIKEMFQMYCNPREHFADLENFAQLFLICGMVVVCVPSHSVPEEVFDTWQHHVAGILVVVAWWVLMLHVGRFPVFGLYVQMFTTVAKNIAKLLGAYLSLIIGFSMGFAVLFPNTKFFADMPVAFLTTVVMMTGELEYNKVFYENGGNVMYHGSTHLIFIVFLLFIVVVLMNLLVGLAVSDIQGLQKSAGLDRLVRQTRLIARMERFIFFPWPINLPCWTNIPWRKVFQRKLLIVAPNQRRKYTFRPNDPRDSRFPSDIKEHLLKIALQGRSARKGGHHHIFRTQTSNSEVYNGELFEQMIHRVDDLFNNYMSQIILMNSTVEEQLSRIERSNTVISTQCSNCDC